MEENDNQFSEISIPQNTQHDQFPIGLKVLAIDHNIVCLKYLVHLLQKCQYTVTATTEAAEALRLLKDGKEAFDIVITNVVRHDMDGFKILDIIGLQMDIPVVMVSANEDLELIKKGVMEGAEAYLLKPVSLKELRNLWQHVLRKRCRKRASPNVMEQALEEDKHINSHETVTINKEEDDFASSLSSKKKCRKRASPNVMEQALEEDKHINSHETVTINKEEDDFASSLSSKKKSRVSWTKELHEKFIAVYDQLVEKERVPNNILKLMNDPNLSRENVASHLQKHRAFLRKKKASGVGEKNYYSTNQRRNEVSDWRPQLPISGQFQFSNMARSSMEQLQGNQNPRFGLTNWTAAGNYSAVPEFKWFNSFSSNNLISKPYAYEDQHLGFGPNNTNNSYYPQYPLESKSCLNSASIDNNVGAIPDQAATPLAWSFSNSNITGGQYSQMKVDRGDSFGSILTDDELSEIFKQFQSEEAF